MYRDGVPSPVALGRGAAARARVALQAPPVRARGTVHVRMDLEVWSGPNRTGRLLGTYVKEYDITLLQFAQVIQAGLLALTGQTLKAIDATTQSITGAITANTPQIEFGTGTTAAAFTDFAIQTAAGGTNPVAGTVTAISGNTFTVTGTWNNTTGVSVTIGEVALYVTTTAGVATNKTIALAHDQFTGVAVSNGGSAACTYTLTFT